LARVYSGATGLFQRIGIERLDRMVNRNLGRIVPPDAIDAVRAAGVSYASVPDSWPAVINNIRPDLLDPVSCPVLFVGGQFDQLRMHTRRFLEHTRDGQVVVIPRATHMFPMTHQAATAKVLRDFIDRVVPA
jgi:pimeloyl-ACP methyl ester carboxylesterase